MGERDYKLIERLDADFNRLSSQDGWTKEDLENMKNLQKLMYYIEVRCAMKEGEEYPGEEYMNDPSYDGRSYGNRYYDGNGSYGRGGSYNSYARGMGNRSYGRRGYNSYAQNQNYGRRYYDGEKENSMNDLRQMISMEQDPEKRSMLENVMHMLEK